MPTFGCSKRALVPRWVKRWSRSESLALTGETHSLLRRFEIFSGLSTGWAFTGRRAGSQLFQISPTTGRYLRRHHRCGGRVWPWDQDRCGPAVDNSVRWSLLDSPSLLCRAQRSEWPSLFEPELSSRSDKTKNLPVSELRVSGSMFSSPRVGSHKMLVHQFLAPHLN